MAPIGNSTRSLHVAPLPLRSSPRAACRSCRAPSCSAGRWRPVRRPPWPPRYVKAAAASSGAEGGSASADTEVDAEISALRVAARLVSERFIKRGATVGLGTGVSVNLLMAELAARVTAGDALRVLAASDAAASEAAFHGLPFAEAGAAVDVMVEVADELAFGDGSPDAAAGDEDAGGTGSSPEAAPAPALAAYIIGRQHVPHVQPQLPRARRLAAAAAAVVVLAESPADVVPRLGGALPVVIDADDWEDTAEEIDDIFLGDAEVWRRSTEPSAGPRGGSRPYVSPEGENILDIRFDDGLKLFGEGAPYARIAAEIEAVPGVLSHGLCVGVATAAVVASPDGPQLYERGAS